MLTVGVGMKADRIFERVAWGMIVLLFFMAALELEFGLWVR
jgi:F0F1-type ATP synthase assembly protein I